MTEINLDVLRDAATRLTVDITEVEEFGVLTRQMETIGRIEGLENYEPMTFPFDCETDYLREDEPETPLPREEALRNAGSVQDNEIKLPKVVL